MTKKYYRGDSYMGGSHLFFQLHDNWFSMCQNGEIIPNTLEELSSYFNILNTLPTKQEQYYIDRYTKKIDGVPYEQLVAEYQAELAEMVASAEEADKLD